MSLKNLRDAADLKVAFVLLKDEFSEDATEADFIGIMHTMFNEGCELFGWEHEGNIVSVACVTAHMDFANGRHLDVQEMATDPNQRSQGHGKKLMDAIEIWAKEQGCEKVVLYSGPQREGAHRFWTHHMGYEHRGLVFKKML